MPWRIPVLPAKSTDDSDRESMRIARNESADSYRRGMRVFEPYGFDLLARVNPKIRESALDLAAGLDEHRADGGSRRPGRGHRSLRADGGACHAYREGAADPRPHVSCDGCREARLPRRVVRPRDEPVRFPYLRSSGIGREGSPSSPPAEGPDRDRRLEHGGESDGPQCRRRADVGVRRARRDRLSTDAFRTRWSWRADEAARRRRIRGNDGGATNPHNGIRRRR